MRNGSERHRAAMIRAWAQAAGRPGDLQPAAGAPLAGQPIYGYSEAGGRNKGRKPAFNLKLISSRGPTVTVTGTSESDSPHRDVAQECKPCDDGR